MTVSTVPQDKPSYPTPAVAVKGINTYRLFIYIEKILWPKKDILKDIYIKTD